MSDREESIWCWVILILSAALVVSLSIGAGDMIRHW